MAHFCNRRIHLVAWQLPAFPWFCPLSNFNLDLVSIDQIFRSHTKAARGHLFDGRAHGAPISKGQEAFWFFAAFASVGFRPNGVHGQCQGGVGFFGDRAKRHGTRGKAFDDVFCGFDCVKGHRGMP